MSSVSIAFATDGVILTPGQVSMQGPLVSQVDLVPSCNTPAESCYINALVGGGAQAVEFVFSLSTYNQLLTTGSPTGCSPDCKGVNILGPSYFGLAFNFAKFPGDDVHFRRALQFIQDFSYIQTTVLNGGEGVASPDLAACPPYPAPSCPLVDPMGIYTYSTTSAGLELEQAGHFAPTGAALPTTDWLYCDNAGVACAGTYSATSEWCVGALGTGSGCGSGTLFKPTLDYRTTHHRTPWGNKMITDLNSIGVQLTTYNNGGGGATTICFTPNQIEVSTPGAYQSSGSLAGYNSAPGFIPANVAADQCDMYTFGFISTTPSLPALADIVNSQFAGTTTNTGNYYDMPTWNMVSDTVQPACPQAGTISTANSVTYESNNVLYAPNVAQAENDMQALIGAVACQVPVIMAYYEYSPVVVNTNGWTGFAGVDETGPSELGGIYYTTMNVHPCGSSTCTLGTGAGMGTLGGVWSYNLEFGMDDSYGSNPTYPSNWVWQADIYNEFYDAPIVVGPTQFNQINAFTDYMVASHTDAIFSGTTGVGGAWYYFQQPCATPLPSATYAARLAACQAKAGPEQHPGPPQRGAGLTLAQRTVFNGEKITYYLKPGLTFYDGQKITALDIMASLDVQNVAAGPNYPDNGAPTTAISGGPNGLIAAHIIPGTQNLGVELYYGTQTAWNLGNSAPAMMPAHILKYYNHDKFSTALCTADLSMPWANNANTAGSSQSCAGLTTGAYALAPSSFIHYLSNLNFGSGPFYYNCVGVAHNPAMSCYDDINSAAVLNANPYYFNLNWQAIATMNVATPATYVPHFYHTFQIYNPTLNPINCGPVANQTTIAAGTWGVCKLMAPYASGALGTVKVYDHNGILVRSLKLGHVASPGPTQGQYFVSIPLTQAKVIGGAPCAILQLGVCFPLTSGQQYEIVISAPFTFKVPGVPSTSTGALWTQVSGFTAP